MEITWLGGSAVRVRSGDAVVVMGADDALPDDLAADIVTMSCGEPRSAGDARVLSGPGEYEIAGFYISGLATALSAGDAEGGERRINTVFSLRAEDVSVCHLGAVAGGADAAPGARDRAAGCAGGGCGRRRAVGSGGGATGESDKPAHSDTGAV